MNEKTSNQSAFSRRDGRELDHWIFRDRESMEKRFGMEMERILELYNTDAGKKQLLERMKQADPALNGNVDRALDLVNKNADQLQKKESFFRRMLMLPVRTTTAVGKTMLRHPVLSALAVLATYGVLTWQLPAIWEYFTAIEEGHAANTLGKAASYLKSFLPFAHGTLGSAGRGLAEGLPGGLH